MAPVVAEIHPTKYFWKRAYLVLIRQIHLCGIPVPVGFRSDGATVPWLLRLFFPPLSGDYLAAAVLHDWLLMTGHSRDYADTMFKRGMKELGVAKIKIAVLYGGVRLWSKLKKVTLPHIALALLFLAIGGCADTPVYEPEPWVLGEQTKPPIGCRELRERDPEANC